ncbi:MAG: sterol desaturase/sphingolipid hydroxylase (fatty acid hydroxylase superfamily) [Gammaproteobacteria bacterium]
MPSVIRTRIAPALVFPLTMSAALFTTVSLLQRDISPAVAALVSVLIFGFALIPVLERLLPYREGWNANQGDFAPDLFYMFLNAGIPKLWTPVQIGFITMVTAWAAVELGNNWWPSNWHWLPQLFLMLLIAEFGRYWMHFAAHKVDWFWRLHSVHHSPNRLYFLNANRFHPIEKLLFQLPEVIPFVILGTSAEALALYFTFNGIFGLTQHSNIHIIGGPLNYLFSLTELHRWHHSQKIEESDRNFGNNLIVWDLLFGTYFNPKARQVKQVGLLNTHYPQTVVGQFKAPFAKSDLSKPTGWKP